MNETGGVYRLTGATTRAHVFCCPVCWGNGLVASGFYGQSSGTWGAASTNSETCRSCDGRGIVMAVPYGISKRCSG